MFMVDNILTSSDAGNVIVNVIGNGHSDTSSNPGQDYLHVI